jgi:hypothetical protein
MGLFMPLYGSFRACLKRAVLVPAHGPRPRPDISGRVGPALKYFVPCRGWAVLFSVLRAGPSDPAQMYTYKSIHPNSKSIVQNNIDYFGQKLFFEKITCAQTDRTLPTDRSRHLNAPKIGNVQISKLLLRTVRRREEHHSGPSADRPTLWYIPSTRLRTRKNTKVPGSIKLIYSVLADHLGCTAGPSATALFNI